MRCALTSTDVGKGFALGFAVAFMGLKTNHVITRWSGDRKRSLGI